MLESRSNGAARFARPAAGQLHEAAISHLLESYIRCLAGNRCVENRGSTERKNQDRESGKVGRITVTDRGSLPRHDRTRLQYCVPLLRKIFCGSDCVCLGHKRRINRLCAFPHCRHAAAFWLLAAFWFAQQLPCAPDAWNYGMAGFLTGLATATKYNGLAVGIALVVAHLMATRHESVRRIILSRKLGLGLAMGPVGFVVGCPTALYEPRKFWRDFLYNYTVTPRYGGNQIVPRILPPLAGFQKLLESRVLF